MKLLRTPDERFRGLSGYPFEPHYAEVEGVRIHYLDEGHRDHETVLMMHGEPSWSYLYRKMIPVVVESGYRVIAPDMVGFGKSDKPAEMGDYSYQKHVSWMSGLIPFLTAFSDSDPITRSGDAHFQETIPGAKGMKQTTITNAGHFLQEDKGGEWARIIVEFIREN